MKKKHFYSISSYMDPGPTQSKFPHNLPNYKGIRGRRSCLLTFPAVTDGQDSGQLFGPTKRRCLPTQGNSTSSSSSSSCSSSSLVDHRSVLAVTSRGRLAGPPGTSGKRLFGVFRQAGTSPGRLARPSGMPGLRQSLGHCIVMVIVKQQQCTYINCFMTQ